MDIKIKGLNRAVVAQSPRGNLQRRIGRITAFPVYLLLKVIQILSHHGSDQLDAGKVRDGILPDKMTVAKNRNPVADRIDLLQEMRNENNTDSLVSQSSHQHKELLHLFIIQG